jgi:hypothetical protein
MDAIHRDIPTYLDKFLASLPPELARAIRESPELFHAQQTEILLRGVSRGMDYLSTVPAFFQRRRWPQHEDAIAFVTAALCYYVWGQRVDPCSFDQRFRQPPRTRFDEAWRRLHRFPRPTARQVIKTLDLGELIASSGINFEPVEPEAGEDGALVVMEG